MKTRRLIQSMMFLVFSVIAWSTSADSRVDDVFETLKLQVAQGRGNLLDMVFGAGSALVSVNARLKIAGRAPFYCPPPDLGLNAYNYADIALRQFERRPDSYKFDILEKYPDEATVRALIDGLVFTFPCK